MKKTFTITGVTISSFLILTLTAYAQGTVSGVSGGASTLAGLVNDVNATLIKAVGTLIMSLAVVAFFWGVVQYIWGAREGEAAKIAAGNQFMVWGLVGLFVMFSVYGIIKFFQGTLLPGVDSSTITIPNVQIKGSTGGGAATGGFSSGSGASSDSGSATGGLNQGSSAGSGSGASGGSNAIIEGSFGNGANVNDGVIQTNVSCSRPNGGSCMVSGVSGTCLDWNCVTQSQSQPTEIKNCPNGAVDVFGDCVADFCTNNPNNPACQKNGGLDPNRIKPNGSSCETSSQCESGYCNGLCRDAPTP